MIPAIVAIVLVVLLAAAIGYSYYEARDLRVRRLSVAFADLPKPFDGYTIAFASDFHVLRIGAHERNVLDRLGEVRADLLVLGGDLQYTRSRSAYGAKKFVDAVGRLAPRFTDGVVATPGNHDSYNLRTFLRRHPVVRYLGDTPLVIRRGDVKIAVAGVRKGPRKRRRQMDRRIGSTVASIPTDVSFRILIAHWADYYPAARRARFDLVLSGDTHGGQIRLPFIGPIRRTRTPRRYAWGLVREGNTVCYTTSGVGVRVLPLRFLCPPEIVVLELRRRGT